MALQIEQYLEQFAKIPMQKKVIGLVGVIIALIVADYFLVYEKQQTAIDKKAGELSKLESDLEKKRGIAQNLSKFKAEVAKLERELAEAKTLLPNEAEIADLMSQIDTLARRSGLDITRFKPGSGREEKFVSRLPFQMEVRGAYNEIGLFMEHVAALPRIVNVSNIKLDKPKFERQKMYLEGSFQITTFRFNMPKAETKKPEGEAPAAGGEGG